MPIGFVYEGRFHYYSLLVSELDVELSVWLLLSIGLIAMAATLIFETRNLE
jgi:hypothetical protein